MNHSHKVTIEEAIDHLFTDVLGSDESRFEYYQAKLDFIFDKLETKPELLGYKIYKLYITQSYLHYIKGNLTEALACLERAEEFSAGKEIQRTYQRASDKILKAAQELASVEIEQQGIETERKTAITALLTGISCLVLGGVLTGITYSLAKPGGTYLVTTGLFLIGAINICLSIYRFMKWTLLKAKRRLS